MCSLGINNTLFNNVSIMAPSFHSLRTKGLTGTIRRFFSLRKRYGFSGKKMKRNLKKYLTILGEDDIPFTMFVPAFVSKKHSGFLRNLNSDLLELGLHGYVHADYREMSRDEIKFHLELSKEIFDQFDMKIDGFRAPYLAWNDELIKELSNVITYDSSASYDSGVIDPGVTKYDKYDMIREYYSPVDEPKLIEKYSVIMIPVWLPDDEILVDRLGMEDQHIGEYWIQMAKKAVSKKTPLVIQLHPERINHCEKALKRLIEFGKSKGAEFVKLSRLAREFKERGKDEKYHLQIAITGDLDMISLTDKKEMNREMKRMRGGV